MLTLPSNQMVLADSVTFNDEVFFVSFSPDSDAAAACNAGQGTNRPVARQHHERRPDRR